MSSNEDLRPACLSVSPSGLLLMRLMRLSLSLIFCIVFLLFIALSFFSSSSPLSPSIWSTQQVAEWLLSLSYPSSLTDRFVKEEIDGSVLFDLNDKDLIALGVTTLGQRKKIQIEIERLKWSDPVQTRQQVEVKSNDDRPHHQQEKEQRQEELMEVEIKVAPSVDDFHVQFEGGQREKTQRSPQSNSKSKSNSPSSSSSSDKNVHQTSKGKSSESKKTKSFSSSKRQTLHKSSLKSGTSSATRLLDASYNQNTRVSESDRVIIRDLMRQALTVHQRNQLLQARVMYEQVLALDPAHARALHMLGLVVMIAEEDAETAIALLQRSLALQEDSDTRVNLGNFFWQQRQLEDAFREWATALEDNFLAGGVTLRARYAESLYTMSLQVYNGGDVTRCRSLMTKALRLAREADALHYPILHVPAWFELQADSIRDSRLELTHQIRQILIDSWLHLGLLADQSGNPALALECYNRGLLIMPSPLDERKPSQTQISTIRQEIYGHRAQLLAHYQSTPANELRALKEAEALALDRTEPHHKKMIEYLHKSCHFDSAASLARQIVDDVIFQSPTYRFLFETQREIENSRERYSLMLDGILKDATVASIWTQPQGLEWCRARFYLAYHGRDDRELNEKLARVYTYLAPSLDYTSKQLAKWDGKRKIRIGFVSAFITAHPVGRTIQGYIEHLPRDQFEVVVFFITLQPGVENDSLLLKMQKWADRFVPLPVEHVTRIRSLVEHESIDLLLYGDIGMEPTSFFMSFSRLAPVQALTYGHPDTSGVPAIDYFVSHIGFDRPVTGPKHYSEKLVELEGVGYWHQSEPGKRTHHRSDYGFSDEQLGITVPPADSATELPTAASPHTWTMYLVTKSVQFYSPVFVDCVARILARHQRSFVVLLLDSGRQSRGFEMHNQCLESINDRIEARLAYYHEGAERSLSLDANLTTLIPPRSELSGRVRFVDKGDHEYFMGLLSITDVLLQPMPLDGTTTTLEALSIATPTVISRSDTIGGRMGSSIYENIGVTDSIADSVDEYVDIAVKLGKSRTANQAIRKLVEKKREEAHLFQNPRAIHNFAVWATQAVKTANRL